MKSFLCYAKMREHHGRMLSAFNLKMPSLTFSFSLFISGYLKQLAVFTQKKKKNCGSLKTSPPSSEKILTSHYCSSLSPVYFYLQQLIQLFPVVTYLSSACFRAISIQRVYKVTALMDFRKEVVFFSVRVGGSSEASCLSSFNWFSVAIGASHCFFFSPMKVQHFRAHCLDSDLQEICQGSSPGFYTHHCLH